MNNKYPDMSEDEPNEKSMVQLIQHLVIRDADTGQIIMNQRILPLDKEKVENNRAE